VAAVQPRGVAQRANPDSPLSAHETLAVRASKHCACCRRTTSLPWVLSWRLPSRRTRALQVGRPRPEGTAARHPGRKRRRQRHWAVASRLRSLLFNRCALSARAPARHWTRRDQQGAGGPSSSPHPPMHLPLLRMLSSYISTPGGAAPPDPPPLRWAGLIRYLPDPLSAHCRGGRCALAPPLHPPPREGICLQHLPCMATVCCTGYMQAHLCGCTRMSLMITQATTDLARTDTRMHLHAHIQGVHACTHIQGHTSHMRIV